MLALLKLRESGVQILIHIGLGMNKLRYRRYQAYNPVNGSKFPSIDVPDHLFCNPLRYNFDFAQLVHLSQKASNLFQRYPVNALPDVTAAILAPNSLTLDEFPYGCVDSILISGMIFSLKAQMHLNVILMAPFSYFN